MLTFFVPAAAFLMENNFSMDAFFESGVPFLSRDEEDEAMAKATERRDRVPERRSLDVKETDHESISFLEAVRRLVESWLALGNVSKLFSLFFLGTVPDLTRIVPRELLEYPSANP